MKVGRNYKIRSSVSPVGTVQLTVKYNSATEAQAASSSSFTSLKYGKKFGYILQKDDGGNGDYQTVFNYLNKGIGYNGANLGIPYYTDGCGNNVKIKASFAVFSFDSLDNDIHDGSNPAFSTWAQYAEIVSAYWSVMNHALGKSDSFYGDRAKQIKDNEIYIYNKLNALGSPFKTRSLVVPSTDEGFTITALYLLYKKIFSAFGVNSSDNIGPTYGSQIRVDNLTLAASDYELLTRTHYGDDWTSSSVVNAAKQQFDYLFAHTDGNQTNMPGDYIRIGFSHGPGTSEAEINNFVSFIQYVINHPSNNDQLWMPSSDEAFDYLLVKSLAVKNESVSGDTRTIELDLSNVPTEVQFLDFSLQVGSGVESVTSSDGSVSFNSSGLVNVTKQRGYVLDPSLDTMLPVITSAVVNTSSPNKLVLTYDRAVNQTLFAAYTIPGTTVTAVSGSGKVWTLSLSSALVQSSVQSTFDYRAQNGDAIDSANSAYKVGSYIGQYITFQS